MAFSSRIKKNWKERCRERFFASQPAIQHRIAKKKEERRRPRRTIERIFEGDLGQSELTQPDLLFVHELAASVQELRTRSAFRQLVLHVEDGTGLLTKRPAHPQFGDRERNTFAEGLLALARNCRSWIRPVRSWHPRSHNVRRQFSSLAGHLLAKHKVPVFMDSVWFVGTSEEAARQQAWYISLGNGQSPRQLDLPIALSKRMVHHFLNSPKHYSVYAALRRGQVMGLGGTDRIVNGILGSRLGIDFDNNDFWITVIRWVIQNPMYDPAQIGPLVDYIHRQKFEPQEIVVGPGRTEVRPANPDFAINGRTTGSLLWQMRQWHGQLRKVSSKPQLEWEPSGIEGFDWAEGVLGSNNFRRWTVIELRSRKDLHHEGQVMRHCVASYDNSCAFGGTSIWSMGLERNGGRRRRVLTIEVANGSKTIRQIRGKANRLPSKKELGIVRHWASQEQLSLADHLQG